MTASARTAPRAIRFAPVFVTLLGLGACAQIPQAVVIDSGTVAEIAPDDGTAGNGGESDDVIATPLPAPERRVISRPIYGSRPIYVPPPVYIVPAPVYPPPVILRPIVPAPPYSGGTGNWIPVTN